MPGKSLDAWRLAVAQQRPIGGLEPAIVTRVEKSGVMVVTRDGKDDTISWDNMKWARPFLSSNSMGPAPRQPGDVLLAISTSGNSKNVVEAVRAAQAKDLVVIALTGRDGGAMGRMMRPADHHLNIAHPRTMRVQEMHLLVIHCLCEVVDNLLFFGEKK